MTGSTPREALSYYVQRVRKAVSCVHPTAHLATDCHNPGDGKRHNLILAGNEPIRVTTAQGSPSYLVYVHRSFEVLADGAEGTWHVGTRGYTYAVMEDTESQRELVAFHWHPGEQAFNEPHLHIPDHPNTRLEHAHIPTGWVQVEAFVSMLIREFRVKAQRTGYRAILEPRGSQPHPWD